LQLSKQLVLDEVVVVVADLPAVVRRRQLTELSADAALVMQLALGLSSETICYPDHSLHGSEREQRERT